MAEVISCFRDAFHRYDSLAGRGGDNTRRYATRSQLLLAEYCCQQSHYSEANAALMRAQSQVLAPDCPQSADPHRRLSFLIQDISQPMNAGSCLTSKHASLSVHHAGFIA